MRRLVFAVLTACVLPLVSGCSISKSISSPFEWSSDSSASSSRSSSGDRSADYQSDVRSYTKAYVQSGGSYDTFGAGLSGIAKKHGVSNWESDMDTFVGIGAGLKQAGVSPTALEVWKTNLSQGDPTKATAIQKGYDATQK
ncbi:MAG: putative lipoprotein [Candidatus Binatia bacterium]